MYNVYFSYIRQNGIFITALEIGRRILTVVRGLIYYRAFTGNPGRLGGGAYIRGLNHITAGTNFRSGKNLWLEALTNYRGQLFQPALRIGDRVSLSHGVHISCIGKLTIGDDTLVGSNVLLCDHNHGIYREYGGSNPSNSLASRALTSLGPLEIRDNVWIGDNVGPSSFRVERNIQNPWSSSSRVGMWAGCI